MTGHLVNFQSYDNLPQGYVGPRLDVLMAIPSPSDMITFWALSKGPAWGLLK